MTSRGIDHNTIIEVSFLQWYLFNTILNALQWVAIDASPTEADEAVKNIYNLYWMNFVVVEDGKCIFWNMSKIKLKTFLIFVKLIILSDKT